MRRWLLTIAVTVILSATCFGCSGGSNTIDGDAPDGDMSDGDSDGPDPDGDEEADIELSDDVGSDLSSYQCTRDSDLLDSLGNCRRDEHCPCGAYCQLGLCHFDCLRNADCPDGWCDYFGRCRDEDDYAISPPLVDRSQGGLKLHPSFIPIYNREAQPVITLSANTQGFTDLRLEASDGLLIDCNGTFSSTCNIESLSTDDSMTFTLKLDESEADLAEWFVSVFYDDRMATVALSEIARSDETELSPGVYRGKVWVSSSSTLLQTEAASQAVDIVHSHPMFSFPFEIILFEDNTLVFHDARKVLPENWVFTLDASGSFDALGGMGDGSRVVYMGNAESSDDETATEVSLSASGAIREIFEGSVLGTLNMTVGGLGLDYAEANGIDERLNIDWNFSVQRFRDLGENETVPSQTGDTPVFAESADRYGDALPWYAIMRDVELDHEQDSIDIPSWSQELQYLLCYDRNRDPGVEVINTRSVPFTQSVADDIGVGDYMCDRGNSDSLLALPFFAIDSASGSVQAGLTLDACITELERSFEAPPACGDTTDLNCLSGHVLDDPLPDCIDTPLVLGALGGGLALVERSGYPGGVMWESRSDDGLRMALRILQQWIQTHQFIVNEAVQANDLPLWTDAPPNLTDTLDLGLDGWDIVLHPHTMGRLMHIPSAILNEPDYRESQNQPAAYGDETQTFGIPIVILHALRTQLQAATFLVRQARFASQIVPPEQVNRTLHYVTVLAPLARLLYEKSLLAGEPAWEPVWQNAQGLFDAALQDLMTEWDSLEEGRNPLGIDDVDLPLYTNTLNDPQSDGEKFLSVSSYFLYESTGGLDNSGWATKAVQTATDSFDAARTAWSDMVDRTLQGILEEQNVNDRVSQIKRNFGEKILNLCGNNLFENTTTGNPIVSEDVLDELEAHPQIGSTNCFMDQGNPACVFDYDALTSSLTKDDLGYRMCVLVGMREGFAGKVEFKEDWANDFLDEAQELMSGALEQLPVNVFSYGMSTMLTDLETTINYLGGDQAFHDLLSDESLEVRNHDALILEDAELKCQALFPNGVPITKKMIDVETSPLEQPDCYHGSIGELALAAMSAAQDIEVANQKLQDFLDAYDIATNNCILLESAINQSQDIKEAYWQISKELKAVKRTADAAFGLAETSFGCATSGAWMSALTCFAKSGSKHIWENTKSSVNKAIPIDKLESKHEYFLGLIQDQVSIAQCFNDAEMHLIGADSQALIIERVKLELAESMLALYNAQEQMSQLAYEGKRRVAAEENRNSTRLFNDIWSDMGERQDETYSSAINIYRRDLAIARRAVYLAVRAVEYELQLTHDTWRQDVLMAANAVDLNNVLVSLRTELAAGASIGGNIAVELPVVVSLKKHLLQLGDLGEFPDGWHIMDDTERLHTVLSNPRYAVFDADGQYLGQEIPFSVVPMGSLGMGETFGIPILAGSDCAERLWGVNATIQGNDLTTNESGSYTRVTLKHKNTFFSQWCLDVGEEFGDLQRSTVRPAKNLFKDPVWGGEDAVTEGTDLNQNDYKSARILAYHNKTQAELEDVGYTTGASEELRARGLYGDYALFIDKDYLATDESDGLNLQQVSDILLRFDYLSIAK